MGFDIYDIGDTDEEDVGFYFDDVSMSRSDSGMDILKQFDETVENNNTEQIKVPENVTVIKETIQKPVKLKRGCKRKESPFITKLDKKSKAKWNQNWI